MIKHMLIAVFAVGLATPSIADGTFKFTYYDSAPDGKPFAGFTLQNDPGLGKIYEEMQIPEQRLSATTKAKTSSGLQCFKTPHQNAPTEYSCNVGFRPLTGAFSTPARPDEEDREP